MPNTTTLTEGIAISGATTGKVLSVQTVVLGTLSNAQKTALANLLATFAGWTGQPGNLISVLFNRMPGNPTAVTGAITGIIVHPDGNAALSARAQMDDILGVVP